MTQGSGDSFQTLAARAPLIDRVNAEPPILNGMSTSEGKWVAGASSVIYLIFGLLVYGITGMWQVAVLLGVMGFGGTIWFGSIWLAQIKRGRPEGYYTQAIHVWLAERGLTVCDFIRNRTWWSLGRELPGGGFASPLVVHERTSRKSRASTPSNNEETHHGKHE